MRTTIDLPDPLFHNIKLVSLQKRISLKQFITNALEAALEASTGTSARMDTPPIVRKKGVMTPLSGQQLAELLNAEEGSKSGI